MCYGVLSERQQGVRDVLNEHVKEAATDLILVSRDYDATDF